MTKISQLVDIGANLAANDEFIIRDVSDASTPNKKVTSSGFIDYIVAQGTGAGFTQIAAGVGPLARALATSSGATGTLTFSTASATTLIERARIDPSGRLLVGTSTARSNFFNTTLSSIVQTEGANASDSNLTRFTSQVFGTAGTAGPIYILAKHRSNSVGDNTVVQSGDDLGVISFQGADGTEFVGGAQIVAQVDGTPGANDMPGRLVFSTTADGAASSTERMRIDSAGRVLVGTATANTSGAKLQTSDGLTFPATAVASADPNTLDDYEEGTWTPTVVGTTTAGTATYGATSGSYTKIGNRVMAHAYINWNSGTGTGNFRISGLPFNANNGVASFGIFTNITLTALSIPVGVAVDGTAYIDIGQFPLGGGSKTPVAYDAGGEILLNVTYAV